MLDVPIPARVAAVEVGQSSETDVESLRGHFFQLDILWAESQLSGATIVGGTLHFGSDRIALDHEHARQLADRVRAAIDSAIAGSVVHRPTHCQQGH